MKKILLSFMLLFAATAMSAQTVKGDMDGDNELTIADVTMLVDAILGSAQQQTVNPFAVDNAAVAGTWQEGTGGSIFALNAGGTTTYQGASTYKYFPYQRLLLLFDADGKPLKTIVLSEVKADHLSALDYTACASVTYNVLTLVSGLTMSQTALTLYSNTTAQLTATATPSNASVTTVVWSSSNTNVATVSESGQVTAVAVGTCTITATTTDGSGVSATCQVTVVAADDHEFVDLGLPSHTLWATCNVGANNPTDYGYYFAWGETEAKSNYDWSTYTLCKGSEMSLTKYCTNSSYGYNGFTDNKTELDPEDDAACMNWGPNWRMPRQTQIDELRNECEWIWTTKDGVNGYEVKSQNGNSIFLPAAGYRRGSWLYDSEGNYWSRTLRTLNWGGPDKAWSYNFESSSIQPLENYRCFGLSVRPVRASE